MTHDQKDCNCMKKILTFLSAPVRVLEKYDLEMNKITASIFLAGVIAMFSAIIAGMVYPGAEEHGAHVEARRGYVIPGAEQFVEGAAPAAAEAVDAGPVDITPFMATADLAAGEKLVKRCTSCHTFDKGGKNGVGPNNYGVVGAKVAHRADFSYSEAMAAHGGKWTFQVLSEFLANPKQTIPGNKMAFAGLRDPKQRANLIAYINSLSDSPLPLPKE